MEMSPPRLSFSSDLPPSPTSRLDDSLPLDPPSDDEFDFSTSSQLLSFHEHYYSTSADLLFSQGRLLPLHHHHHNNNNDTTSINSPPPPPLPPSIPAKNHQTLKQILAEDNNVASCSRKSSASSSSHATHPFWYAFTRSSSVSAAASSNKTMTGPFPRSKSTGCNPDRSLQQHPTKSRKQDARGTSFWKLSRSTPTSNSNAKAYYYSGDGRASTTYGNGVRINPVINLPAPFITRGGSSNSNSNSSSSVSVGVGGSTSSFFAYLLCNCRDKTMEAERGSPAAASL